MQFFDIVMYLMGIVNDLLSLLSEHFLLKTKEGPFHTKYTHESAQNRTPRLSAPLITTHQCRRYDRCRRTRITISFAECARVIV